ncbi:MAG: thiamine biosynthesis protein ThiJ [Leptolyngbyaceae cyanobacterium CSU_1_3]|nr:thiamine biosynthesis protein ThiJ [Leptolyngbyaceae cyanobacterium CSU_1_3]
MKLKDKKIGILIESDFYEQEIWYYNFRFKEEGAEVHFLSRLWGQPSLTFKGHEYHAPFECHESFENMSVQELRSYSAIIVPAGMVADRLRWTDDLAKEPPALEFMRRAFAEKTIIKGIICHGMWLLSRAPDLVKGRRVTCHNNLYGDVLNMGAIYTDQDVIVDFPNWPEPADLVTARSGGHCHVFAKQIIKMLSEQR